MGTYAYRDAYAQCLEYFEGDGLAASVISSKYLLREGDDLFESNPDQLIDRITDEFVRIEQNYPNSLSREEIREAFDGFKYIIPQGSPLSGIGNTKQLVSIGNCFVIGSPYDSWGGICKKDEELSQIMKRRGGVGIDLSTLRPNGAPVNNAARSSAGVPCFMEKYSNTTLSVAQNGRRGALMIALDCRHPDIESFINIKKDLSKITGANISVKWHDEFLECCEANRPYTLRFPVDATIEEAVATKEVNAKEIWDSFVEAAHECAEPGGIFWNTVIGQSISDNYDDFQTIVSNPCGEIFMSAYNACILMLMNLTSFVDNKFTDEAFFNVENFKKYVRTATKLIDDMIDLEIEKVDAIIAKIKASGEPEDIIYTELKLWEKIRENYINGRRVGLGITGLGDVIAYMNIKYDSDEAVELCDFIFSTLHTENFAEQAVLAEERGAFPAWEWEREKDDHYIGLLPEQVKAEIQQHGRRNISTTTCSPAGSVSMLTQTTSGIEPVYLLEYDRYVKMNDDDEKSFEVARIDDDGFKFRLEHVVHHGFQAWKEMYPDRPIEECPYHGCQAGDLDWRQRVKIQSTIQKYITHSISSTVNLHKDATVGDVSELYMEAWKLGCKGITVFRDGSRNGILVQKGDAPDSEHVITIANAPKRPKELDCEIHYSNIQNNEWIFFVGLLDGVPFEIFGGKRERVEMPKRIRDGKTIKNGRDEHGRRTYDFYHDKELVVKDIAGEFSPDAGSYTRQISLELRHGVPIKFICEQLRKDDKSNHMFSFESGISRVLSKYIKKGEKSSIKCTSCGQEMVHVGGCVQCLGCGNSMCL